MAHHIIPPRSYYKVFAALMVLLVLTVWAAEIEHPILNTVIAITIAVTKALLIILIFMHVKYSKRLVQVVAFVGFAFFLLLLALMVGDYATRDWQAGSDQATSVAPVVRSASL